MTKLFTHFSTFTLFILLALLKPTSAAGQTFRNYVDGLNSSLHLRSEVTSLDGLVNRIVPLFIVISGSILLIMLIYGGFQMLTSAGNPEQAQQGQKRITTALIGFLLLISAYWIIQILEVVFGINILF